MANLLTRETAADRAQLWGTSAYVGRALLIVQAEALEWAAERAADTLAHGLAAEYQDEAARLRKEAE